MLNTQMKWLRSIFFVIFGVFLLQACACYTCYQPHAYYGPEKASDDLAIIYGKVASQHDNSTYTFMKVNDISFDKKRLPAKIYVPAGKHKIILRAYRGHYARYPTIEANFKAGHAYQIKQDVGVSINNMPDDRYYAEDMGTDYTPWNQVFREPPKHKVYK